MSGAGKKSMKLHGARKKPIKISWEGLAESFSLTLMINKDKTKVLFASVDNDFADVLLHFLTLPLGVILKLLDDHYGKQAPTFGSLNTLYTGLQNLDSVYFGTETGKQMLLNPRSSLEQQCSKLKTNLYGTRPSMYSLCTKCSEGDGVVSLYQDSSICLCGGTRFEVPVADVNGWSNGEVFSKKTVSFLISDDLRILPNVTGPITQSLKNWGITDVSGAMLKTVTVGFNKILVLLKLSLLSETPLTNLFLQRGIHQNTTTKAFLPHVKKEKNLCAAAKRMKVTAMVQKTNHKILFARAEKDFLDFLFSLLTISLGEVENLLTMNSSLGCVDNLYRSVAIFDGQKCLNDRYTTAIFLKPRLPPKYVSKSQIFPLVEETPPGHLCFSYKTHAYSLVLSPDNNNKHDYYSASFVDPKGQLGSYVTGNGMFMVTDDLTVTPLFKHSSLSALTGLRIPLSDIEEHEIHIGLDEALNILKASLTSTSALTNGLRSKLASLRRPKRERS